MINHLLFVGETIFLFEGVPHFLSPTYFWDMVEEHQITAMFTTPSTLDEIEATGYLPSNNTLKHFEVLQNFEKSKIELALNYND